MDRRSGRARHAHGLLIMAGERALAISKGLVALLALQVLISGATGVVLLIAPDAIPHSFGLAINRDAHIICYLLAVAELGLAGLSIAALRTDPGPTLSLLFGYFIFFHVASGLAGLFGVLQGMPKDVLANSATHGVVVVLFVIAFRAQSRGAMQP